ncbi:lysophospholipid acyltransferase family protein [Parabacteroides sp. PF5-9]|uniref:lysophospholipid acyltransferase family protein n=1 Tax=Parabacteroides sp. PF5-9 TaxID=1742404 RepID=UPI002473B67E|nr:lysophospholipid acyltransferase family protein [Parabacteroides sp. PF5-9]MDH6357168.1 KDO2-lipid IV(A) lauroyltransferase [Parabacteroides sp. PF5-9]
MNRLFFAFYFSCFYAGIYLVSLLPMIVLYRISAFSSFMMLHVFSYRKGTVIQNLSRSFPEKNYEEIDRIMREFYRSFADNAAEILKSLSISSENQMDKVISITGMDLIEEQLLNNKHVIVSMGHCGNWELLSILSLHASNNMYAVYKPLKNKAMDKLFLTMRSRFGMQLVPAKSVVRHILSNKNNPSVYFFIADQCPKLVEEKYRVHMLNQTTSMFTGVEKLARSVDAPVMYMHITRSGRGQYHVSYKPICLESKMSQETEIIQHYSSLLEQNIREKPSDWLWTHKRWKR